jgi:hypothetical protein
MCIPIPPRAFATERPPVNVAIAAVAASSRDVFDMMYFSLGQFFYRPKRGCFDIPKRDTLGRRRTDRSEREEMFLQEQDFYQMSKA